MTPHSDTPETDAAEAAAPEYATPGYIHADFARNLERQRNEAREELDEERHFWQAEREDLQADIEGFYAEAVEARRERDEARAELAAANKGAKRNAEALAISTAKLNEAREENARLREALQRIADCTDAPDIDPVGEIRFGLHCGVEDRDCTDRYDGVDYGFACGTERALEWASNEARRALTP